MKKQIDRYSSVYLTILLIAKSQNSTVCGMLSQSSQLIIRIEVKGKFNNDFTDDPYQSRYDISLATRKRLIRYGSNFDKIFKKFSKKISKPT